MDLAGDGLQEFVLEEAAFVLGHEVLLLGELVGQPCRERGHRGQTRLVLDAHGEQVVVEVPVRAVVLPGLGELLGHRLDAGHGARPDRLHRGGRGGEAFGRGEHRGVHGQGTGRQGGRRGGRQGHPLRQGVGERIVVPGDEVGLAVGDDGLLAAPVRQLPGPGDCGCPAEHVDHLATGERREPTGCGLLLADGDLQRVVGQVDPLLGGGPGLAHPPLGLLEPAVLRGERLLLALQRRDLGEDPRHGRAHGLRELVAHRGRPSVLPVEVPDLIFRLLPVSPRLLGPAHGADLDRSLASDDLAGPEDPFGARPESQYGAVQGRQPRRVDR